MVISTSSLLARLREPAISLEGFRGAANPQTQALGCQSRALVLPFPERRWWSDSTSQLAKADGKPALPLPSAGVVDLTEPVRAW
jgi:hypothetical protein